MPTQAVAIEVSSASSTDVTIVELCASNQGGDGSKKDCKVTALSGKGQSRGQREEGGVNASKGHPREPWYIAVSNHYKIATNIKLVGHRGGTL